MLLAIDIGNTEVTIGLFEAERLRAKWRLTSTTVRTADEWMVTLTALLTQAGHSTQEVGAIVYGSVAPGVTGPLVDGVRQACEVEPMAVGPDSDLGVTLDVAEPMTVGADRVVNTLAARELFGRDTVVVDFGTATTFDCILADGRFIGGVIAPGLATAADQLIRRAAKIPATELAAPSTVIGRRTEDCVRSGVVFGAVDAVDGIVRRIRAEWPGDTAPLVVATGGLAGVIAPLSVEIDRMEPDLTLNGLRLAARRLRGGGRH